MSALSVVVFLLMYVFAALFTAVYLEQGLAWTIPKRLLRGEARTLSSLVELVAISAVLMGPFVVFLMAGFASLFIGLFMFDHIFVQALDVDAEMSSVALCLGILGQWQVYVLVLLSIVLSWLLLVAFLAFARRAGFRQAEIANSAHMLLYSHVFFVPLLVTMQFIHDSGRAT
jgi:hypothetical protein